MHTIFIIYMLIEGHLGCSHFLAFVNKAAMNMAEHVWMLSCLGKSQEFYNWLI